MRYQPTSTLLPGMTPVAATVMLACLSLSACAAVRADEAPAARGPVAVGSAVTTDPGRPAATPSPAPRATPDATSRPTGTKVPSRVGRPKVLASDGTPRSARLSIPALGIKNLQVTPHRGSPDDAGGTRIQNRGMAASPYGRTGGVGPGGIGNHIVTAHRLSSTRAFLNLPKLHAGAKVNLVAGGRRYIYRIVRTRVTSFRSSKSLAAQAAAVPGRPGVPATKAMITLSTCRTLEDHAEGNYWSDEFGNPEHRIDKIGELVAVRPV
jgi:sortase A